MRRILGLVFSYALALQAILSAYGAALALTEAGEASLGFVICHSAAEQAPDSSGTSKHPAVPCPMCVTACSAAGLPPDSASAISVLPPSISRVAYSDTAVTTASRPARAGLARAPPQSV